ncbi:MAG: response regulator transcription factor [Anaerolineae bacterium]|nr:response regulator transcription factor [Anaerolineae bacterium]
MPTVLIVDDDERLLRMLQRTLVYEGMDVVTATDGHAALAQVTARRPDVVILDWMMPGLDGIQVVRRLREREDETMVLMLTARDAIENRVEGLESGADDYLVKPFAPAELVARVHALLRRTEAGKARRVLSYGGLTLDPDAHLASRDGVDLALTPTEFDLLHLLMRHPGQVLEREQILTQVWGYDFGGDDNVLEVYVGYLRRKLEAGGGPRLIHTMRGVGYVLREEA